MNDSPFKGRTGLRRLLNAWRYSLEGLRAAWRHEAAFRQIVLLTVIGLGFLCWLPLPAWARAVLGVSHLLCLVVELFNSAIEAAVDHTSLDLHPLAKRAKDLGSAAQLLSLTSLAAAWAWALFNLP